MMDIFPRAWYTAKVLHTSLPQDQQQEGGGDVEDPADRKVNSSFRAKVITQLGYTLYPHMLSVLSQWDSDVAQGKVSEEKLQGLFKQQQKLFQQQRIVQAQTQDHQAAARTIHEGTAVCVCVCMCGLVLLAPNA